MTHTYTSQDRDSLLKAVQRVTVSIAALSLTAACAFFVGVEHSASNVVADPPQITVQAPAVYVTVKPTITVAPAKTTVANPVATYAPKDQSAPKVTTTKKVVTSGGS